MIACFLRLENKNLNSGLLVGQNQTFYYIMSEFGKL